MDGSGSDCRLPSLRLSAAVVSQPHAVLELVEALRCTAVQRVCTASFIEASDGGCGLIWSSSLILGMLHCAAVLLCCFLGHCSVHCATAEEWRSRARLSTLRWQ